MRLMEPGTTSVRTVPLSSEEGMRSAWRAACGVKRESVRRLALNGQDEADAAPSADADIGARVGELAANSSDVDVHHVRAGVEVHVPDPFEQLRARDDLVTMQEEVFEEGKLLRRQGHFGPVDEELPRQTIQH